MGKGYVKELEHTKLLVIIKKYLQTTLKFLKAQVTLSTQI